MATMNTDVAVLAAEASNFDRISGELKSVMAQVEAHAESLKAAMVGDAGLAAQAALTRYHEAALQQQQELMDISNNIHTAGVQYASADEDQASSLASTMQL